jgi:hypothetical protein
MLDRGIVWLCPALNSVSGLGIFDYDIFHPNNQNFYGQAVAMAISIRPSGFSVGANRGSMKALINQNNMTKDALAKWNSWAVSTLDE